MPYLVRSVFFGTPSLAVPALRTLHATSELVGVVCQPDRPAGRGLQTQQSAVKEAATSLGVQVYQPTKVRTGELGEWLRARRPDVAVVLAYGRILPPDVLGAPRRGCLNLHASPLPRWRGAAPIQWAIMSGDHETGVSLMQMDEGLDTGPVYVTRRVPIGANETAAELGERLALLCATMVETDLPRVLRGELEPQPQDEALATYAPPIRSEHCGLDWTLSATRLAAQVRALAPRPGARTWKDGTCLRVVSARSVPDSVPGPPGRVTVERAARVLVATGNGTLEVLAAQREGRRVCESRDLINGRAVVDGMLFETLPSASA